MPRAGLTAERVVAEAGALADEIGLSRLTLTALAERLGVRQPSLYKHVAGTDALLRGISVQAKRDLGAALGTAAQGRSGPDALAAVGRAYRDWALAHPGRYPATQSPPAPGDTDDETASAGVVSVMTSVLAAWDLAGDAAVHAVRAVRSCLHGFVILELSGGFGLPLDVGTSFELLLAGLGGLVAPAA